MKSLAYVLLIVALTCVLAGCAKDTTQEASATTLEGQPPASVQPAPAAATPPAARPAAPKPVAKGADAAAPAPGKAAVRMFEVPEGTEVSVFLVDPISTAKNKAGDTFTATIAEPIIVNDETVVNRGAKVEGRVVDAEGSGRIKGTANIRLTLTSIDSGGKSYPITTRPFAAEAESTKGRDAGIIAGGGGVGAAIGALTGGKKGAVKGAVIGGVAGTGAVLATKGKEVEFNSETKLNFTLEHATELPKIR